MSLLSRPHRRLLLLLFVLSSGLLGGCRPAPAPAADAVKLLVGADGPYRVSLSALRAAGFAVETLDVGRLRLAEAGKQVPYHVDGNDLVFYGQAATSRYTAYRTYVLEAGKAGMQMETRAARPGGQPRGGPVTRTRHLEENLEYVSDAHRGSAEGPWFWQTIQIEGSATLEFELPPVADGSGQLALSLYGSTHNPSADPDHTLGVRLNEQPLGTISWDGQVGYTATLPLPTGTLQTGANRLVLDNVPEDYLDIMKLDWVDLRYPAEPVAGEAGTITFSGSGDDVTLSGFDGPLLILDVTAPAAPALLTGWEETETGATFRAAAEQTIIAAGAGGYLEPAQIEPLRESDWRQPEQQADLIIITTDALAPALTPLVAAREDQGLSVALVPVAEIYDSFGHGAPSPDAINTFLAYAAQEWEAPHPRYLLLVGDATTDFRGYLAGRDENPVSPPENVIPPYLVSVNYSGETVSDARLADVDGDFSPDMAVGRWPVDSAAAVERLVARTLAYEAGDASDRALFAADGSSDEFRRLSERLVARSALPAASTHILSGPSAAEMAERWNDGAWLVTYTGHGSLKLWGKESIFSVENVGQLDADAPAPIVLQLTCLSGLFAHPEITSLSERMLAEEGGPVLTVAATSLTLSSHQEPFAARFLEALHDPSVERVGDALQLAKASLDMSDGSLREISDTFGLLGDPSALVKRPPQ